MILLTLCALYEALLLEKDQELEKKVAEFTGNMNKIKTSKEELHKEHTMSIESFRKLANQPSKEEVQKLKKELHQ